MARNKVAARDTNAPDTTARRTNARGTNARRTTVRRTDARLPWDAEDIVDLTNEDWIAYKPRPKRDVRKILKERFVTLDAMEKERRKRSQLIRKRSLLTIEDRDSFDRTMLRILGRAQPRRAAPITSCPVLARRFQIFFADRALQIDRVMQKNGYTPKFVTLVDLNDAISDLSKVNARKLHDKVRYQLRSCLRPGVVVIGYLEFERNGRQWQPHYHLMIYHAPPRELRRLRAKHYVKVGRTGPRPMVVKKVTSAAGAFSYMSKLVSFAKIPRRGMSSKRARLRPPLLLDYMRFIATRRPTQFVLSLNCSIVKGRRSRVKA